MVVLIDRAHPPAEAAIPAVALRRTASNCAENAASGATRPATYPDRAFSIFNDLKDSTSLELRMRDQLAMAPAHETSPCSDP